MSKLLKQYDELKKKDPEKVYIFKVGIFYNILNEDARLVSREIGLKLTDLSPEIIKCGFPVAKLEKYTNILKAHKLIRRRREGKQIYYSVSDCHVSLVTKLGIEIVTARK